MIGCSDDDSPASPDEEEGPVVSINDQTVIEGGTAIFIVSLSEAMDSSVTFQFSTSDGTAKAPGDYTAVPLTADTILPGSTAVVLIVATIDDDSLEQAEVFYLILGDLKKATFAKSIGTCTIMDNDAVSYATDVKPILMGSCAKTGCHGGGSSKGGLSMGLAEYDTIISATGDNTSGGIVVVPGSSSASTLYTKTLETTDSLFPFPNRMPCNGPPFLSTEQQQRIRDWIDQGAQDN